MQRVLITFLPVLAVMIFFPSNYAAAQSGFGVRAGVGADPAQFHLGAHYVSDPLIGELTFRPNFEIGFGNDVTATTLNFEFAYRIPIRKTDVSAYIGAGPALVVRRFSEDRGRGTDTGGGFNILLGLEHSKGLFGELKVGAMDSPDIKFTLGYTFR